MAIAKADKTESARSSLVSGLRIRKNVPSRFKDLIDTLEPRSLANALFQRPLDMIFICDTDGIIVHANNNMLRAIDYSLEELKVLNLQCLLALEGFEPFMTLQQRLKDEGDVDEPCRLVLRKKCDAPLPILARPTLLTSNGGTAEAVLWHAQSLEYLESVECELGRLREFARVSNNAAHDMKNFIMAPQGLLEQIAEFDPNNTSPAAIAALKGNVGIALGCIERISNLLQEMRFYARPKKENQKIDINSLLADVTLHLHLSKPDDVEIEFEFDPNAGHVMGNQHALENAMMNIVKNAFDAMERGGTLTISSSVHPERCETVMITISDNGCGIAPEFLTKIFDPHFTTKKTGTGLGLSIVRQAVREHEGSITVDSQIGNGTTFCISLPKS